MIFHPIPPVYNSESNILVLGSFPSVKSRESGFYYGNRNNRFWKVLSDIYEEKLPLTIEEKKVFLLRNQIALWDVIESCEIHGSSDATISNVTVNDIEKIVKGSAVSLIVLNGKTAYRYYQKFVRLDDDCKVACLPSTSPANAAWTYDALVLAWREVLIGNGS